MINWKRNIIISTVAMILALALLPVTGWNMPEIPAIITGWLLVVLLNVVLDIREQQ